MAIAGNKASVDITGRSSSEQGVTESLRAGAADVEIHGKNAVTIHAAKSTAARFTADTTVVNTDMRLAGSIEMLHNGTPAWRLQIDDDGRLLLQRRNDGEWESVARFE